jgi:hypothetical protein
MRRPRFSARKISGTHFFVGKRKNGKHEVPPLDYLNTTHEEV